MLNRRDKDRRLSADLYDDARQSKPKSVAKLQVPARRLIQCLIEEPEYPEPDVGEVIHGTEALPIQSTEKIMKFRSQSKAYHNTTQYTKFV